MPPVYRHGRGSRVIVSTIDASSLFNEFTASISAAAEEVTVFGEADREYITGLREGTFTAQGFLDVSTAGTNDPYRVFRTALGSTTRLVITAIPGGPGGSTVTPGSLCRLGNAIETNLEVGAPAAGVVTAKFDATLDDRFDVGRTLYGPGGAKATTFAGTSVDSGVAAGTTGGGVAHFHVTLASTVTSVTYKVQHSSNNSAWSDLATFTSTSTGTQRTVVTGTVKRYTRGTITAFTGGAGKSVKPIIAFARRGAVR